VVRVWVTLELTVSQSVRRSVSRSVGRSVSQSVGQSDSPSVLAFYRTRRFIITVFKKGSQSSPWASWIQSDLITYFLFLIILICTLVSVKLAENKWDVKYLANKTCKSTEWRFGTKIHFLTQGYGTNCGRPIYSGVTSDADKSTIVNAHNNLRRQVAGGKESRGNPGPQPPAANMRKMVSTIFDIQSSKSASAHKHDSGEMQYTHFTVMILIRVCKCFCVIFIYWK